MMHLPETRNASFGSVKGLGPGIRFRSGPARRTVVGPRAVLSTPTQTEKKDNEGRERESSSIVDAPTPTPSAAASVAQEPLAVEQIADGSNPIGDFWVAYNELLDEQPILVKSLTSFVGFMLGDILSQVIVGDPYSAIRTLHLVMYGVIMDGPCGHFWYTTLDKNVFPEDPVSTKAIVAKTTMDQLIWGPFITAVFFAFIRTVQGHPDQIIPTIQVELVPTILASYALWPVAHAINFRFIPSSQRILYINCVQIVWTAYLSNLAAHGHGSLPMH